MIMRSAMKWTTSSAVLVASLVYVVETSAQVPPVYFDVETSTGNDTLFVGIPGKINFTLDANGYDIIAIAFPFELVFSSENVIGPLADPGNVSPSAAVAAAFDNIYWTPEFGVGSSPDTLLYGFIDFGGPLWGTSGTIWSIDVSASGPGSVRFDSITLPPGSKLEAFSPLAIEIPTEYLFDGQVVEFVHPPPGDVLFDIVTSTGNDTLFVGRPGQIHFTVDANGNRVSGLTFMFEAVFSSNNVIGPLTEGVNVHASQAALSPVFESISWNSAYGTGGNPDTLLYGFIDFAGPLWENSGIVWSIDVTASGPSSVRFDPIWFDPNCVCAVDPDANDLPIQYLFDGQVVEFVVPRVIFDVETSTGNDTLFVGGPGSINFTVDANGYDVAGILFSFEMVFSSGNVVGPISDDGGGVSPSAAAIAAFESMSWNRNHGQGTDPDTIQYGFIDFGGPLWDGSGRVWSINFRPTGVGTVHFDDIFLPPASGSGAVDSSAHDLPVLWLLEGKEIVFVMPPSGDVNSNGRINATDIVYLVNFTFKGGPAPYPFALGDVDASCTITSADIIYLVNFVFKSGPSPLVGCE